MSTINRACWMSVAVLASSIGVVAAQETLDRTMLPIAEPKPPTYDELDARDAKAPARFEIKAPSGAPNVVIVLIDDIGFGGPSTFHGVSRPPAAARARAEAAPGSLLRLLLECRPRA
jgi:hypothetical protein